jgi:hypothetical protein
MHLDAGIFENPGDDCTRPFLLESQFRMRVQIPAELLQEREIIQKGFGTRDQVRIPVSSHLRHVPDRPMTSNSLYITRLSAHWELANSLIQ